MPLKAMKSKANKVWKKLSSEDLRLATMWFHDASKSPSEIAELLHRGTSTLTRLLVKIRLPEKQGRPLMLKPEHVRQLIKLLEKMIAKANGLWWRREMFNKRVFACFFFATTGSASVIDGVDYESGLSARTRSINALLQSRSSQRGRNRAMRWSRI